MAAEMESCFGDHIALTGGIGSGKSSVAAFLATLGWPILDADQIARQLLEKGAAGWQALAEVFGDRYFAGDGTVDRRLLRQTIFTDGAVRQTLNSLLHPLVRGELLHLLGATGSGRPRCLVEVALLYESGWQSDFGTVVVVYADQATCLGRVMARDGASKEEAMAAMAAQLPLLAKAGWADQVIDNSGAWLDTCRQLRHWDRIVRDKWDRGEKSLDRGRRRK